MSKGRPWQDLTCFGVEDDHDIENGEGDRSIARSVSRGRELRLSEPIQAGGLPNAPLRRPQDHWTKFEDEAADINGRDCRRRRRGRDTLGVSPPSSRPWIFSIGGITAPENSKWLAATVALT